MISSLYCAHSRVGLHFACLLNVRNLKMSQFHNAVNSKFKITLISIPSSENLLTFITLGYWDWAVWTGNHL